MGFDATIRYLDKYNSEQEIYYGRVRTPIKEYLAQNFKNDGEYKRISRDTAKELQDLFIEEIDILHNENYLVLAMTTLIDHGYRIEVNISY